MQPIQSKPIFGFRWLQEIYLWAQAKAPAAGIRWHLAIAMVLVGFVPLITFWGVMKADLGENVLEDAHIQLKVRAEGISERIAGVMGGLSGDLRALQTEQVIQGASSGDEELVGELLRLQNVYDQFLEISLYDEDGFIIESTDQNGHAVFRDRTMLHRQAVELGVITVSPPKKRLDEDQLYMDVYLPVRDYKGTVFRVIKASTSFKAIEDVIKGATVGDNGYFALMNESGTILIHPKAQDRRLGPLEELAEIKTGRVFLENEAHLATTWPMDSEETKAGQGWILAGVMPEKEAIALVSGTQYNLVLGLVISMCAATTVALVLGWSFQRSLKPLVAATDVVAAKEWDDIVAIPEERGAQEFRDVACSFNRMVEQIGEHSQLLEQEVERQTAELVASRRQLTETNAQMRASIQSTLEGVLVVSTEGEIQNVNRRFLEFFGYRPKEGRFMTMDLLHEQVEATTKDLVGFEGFTNQLEVPETPNASGRSEVEWHVLTPKERFLKVYTVYVHGEEGEVIAHMWVFRDCTEARELEEKLQQSQKMEAVGRLAGGIAHDFNNLLTGIIGHLSLLDIDIEKDGEFPGQIHLDFARQAANRAADLVKRLLGYSRQTFLKKSACDTSQLLNEIVTFLETEMEENINVKTEIVDDVWGVLADTSQVHSVLMNLCVNGRHAMEENGGTLTLSCDNVRVTAQDVRKAPSDLARPGEFVKLSVRDTGTGIDPDTMKRIFEPFFTTKGQGKGTGLGLATSVGVIEQHKGWMECESEVGVGTAFHMFLPRDESRASKKKIQAPIALPKKKADGGSETVLLVDDEKLVRTVSEKYLTAKGYRVLIAGDGEEGLEVYAKHKDEIRIVMLDLTMPKLSGGETFSRIRKIDRNLPVVIYSGYLVDGEKFAEETGSIPNAILCKPFELEDVASLIRKVIDGESLEFPIDNAMMQKDAA